MNKKDENEVNNITLSIFMSYVAAVFLGVIISFILHSFIAWEFPLDFSKRSPDYRVQFMLMTIAASIASLLGFSIGAAAKRNND